MGISFLVCFILGLLPLRITGKTWQCQPIAYNLTRDYTVKYDFPTFRATSAIQNMVTYPPGNVIFVAVQNKIYTLNSELKILSTLVTGPWGSTECKICALCRVKGPVDFQNTDNKVLVMDPVEPWLYSCGSSQHGICFQHTIQMQGDVVLLAETSCLYSPEQNSPSKCSDCVASPLGTRVVIVDMASASYFYIASTINATIADTYSPKSVSIRRPKSTLDGFADGFHSLTVLPEYQDTYHVHYVYSFQYRQFVYFLTVQKEDPTSNSYHTRIVRLSTEDIEVHKYRELNLECRIQSKRKRSLSIMPKDVVFNVLQAAHATNPGAKLAQAIGTTEKELVLFGVFAESQPDSMVPKKYSGVCAFPLYMINKAIETGMTKCCSLDVHDKMLRGLTFYQDMEYCPHNCLSKKPDLDGALHGATLEKRSETTASPECSRVSDIGCTEIHPYYPYPLRAALAANWSLNAIQGVGHYLKSPTWLRTSVFVRPPTATYLPTADKIPHPGRDLADGGSCPQVSGGVICLNTW